jgi:hypothetical protein
MGMKFPVSKLYLYMYIYTHVILLTSLLGIYLKKIRSVVWQDNRRHPRMFTLAFSITMEKYRALKIHH